MSESTSNEHFNFIEEIIEDDIKTINMEEGFIHDFHQSQMDICTSVTQSLFV